MFSCFKGDPKNKLTFNEISFCSYAAFIRGAIAFGLVEQIPADNFKFKRVIVSSTLVLVVVSTIIFGSFTPIVQKFLFPKTDSSFIIKMDEENSNSLPKSMTEGFVSLKSNPSIQQEESLELDIDENLKTDDNMKTVEFYITEGSEYKKPPQ